MNEMLMLTNVNYNVMVTNVSQYIHMYIMNIYSYINSYLIRYVNDLIKDYQNKEQ